MKVRLQNTVLVCTLVLILGGCSAATGGGGGGVEPPGWASNGGAALAANADDPIDACAVAKTTAAMSGQAQISASARSEAENYLARRIKSALDKQEVGDAESRGARAASIASAAAKASGPGVKMHSAANGGHYALAVIHRSQVVAAVRTLSTLDSITRVAMLRTLGVMKTRGPDPMW